MAFPVVRWSGSGSSITFTFQETSESGQAEAYASWFKDVYDDYAASGHFGHFAAREIRIVPIRLSRTPGTGDAGIIIFHKTANVASSVATITDSERAVTITGWSSSDSHSSYNAAQDSDFTLGTLHLQASISGTGGFSVVEQSIAPYLWRIDTHNDFFFAGEAPGETLQATVIHDHLAQEEFAGDRDYAHTMDFNHSRESTDRVATIIPEGFTNVTIDSDSDQISLTGLGSISLSSGTGPNTWYYFEALKVYAADGNLLFTDVPHARKIHTHHRGVSAAVSAAQQANKASGSASRSNPPWVRSQVNPLKPIG